MEISRFLESVVNFLGPVLGGVGVGGRCRRKGVYGRNGAWRPRCVVLGTLVVDTRASLLHGMFCCGGAIMCACGVADYPTVSVSLSLFARTWSSEIHANKLPLNKTGSEGWERLKLMTHASWGRSLVAKDCRRMFPSPRFLESVSRFCCAIILHLPRYSAAQRTFTRTHSFCETTLPPRPSVEC